jgi:hypothetical protein
VSKIQGHSVAGDVKLGITSFYMALKAMGLGKVTSEGAQ